MALKIFLQVITGDYFRFIIALPKNYTNLFSITRFSLQSKSWTRPVPPVGFIKIDNALMHDFVNVFLADMPAIHPA
jgi:hypothetical protein